MSDSDDSSYDNIADEEEKNDFLLQLSKYKKALDKFCMRQDDFEKAIPVVSQLGWKERGELVLGGYDELLIDLHDRPNQLKMGYMGGINELECWSNAIRIGWKLWPDWWLGLQMIVDYLAENTVKEDILRLEKHTLLTLKEIALCTEWPNNDMGGKILAAQAKIILYRYSHKCTFPEASLNPMVRIGGLDLLMGMSSMLSSLHSEASTEDPRRICSRTMCTEVESND